MESTWTFNIGPIPFDGTITVMTFVTVLIVFGLVFWASRNMQLKVNKMFLSGLLILSMEFPKITSALMKHHALRS